MIYQWSYADDPVTANNVSSYLPCSNYLLSSPNSYGFSNPLPSVTGGLMAHVLILILAHSGIHMKQKRSQECIHLRVSIRLYIFPYTTYRTHIPQVRKLLPSEQGCFRYLISQYRTWILTFIGEAAISNSSSNGDLSNRTLFSSKSSDHKHTRNPTLHGDYVSSWLLFCSNLNYYMITLFYCQL